MLHEVLATYVAKVEQAILQPSIREIRHGFRTAVVLRWKRVEFKGFSLFVIQHFIFHAIQEECPPMQ